MNIIPRRVTYTNFRKEFPSLGMDRAFNRWFSVSRFWRGEIICVAIRWHQLSFDFRENWLADMFPKRKGKP